MRNRRLMMMMAGLIPDAYEQRLNREQRHINRYGKELEQRLQLLTLIQRRERGEEGTKPMPFARKPE